MFRLHDCDCCQKRAWPNKRKNGKRKMQKKKKVLDDQEDSYDVFSGKVKKKNNESHCEV